MKKQFILLAVAGLVLTSCAIGKRGVENVYRGI